MGFQIKSFIDEDNIMRIKKLVKAAFAVIVFGVSASVLAGNTNTTIQEGGTNVNDSFMEGTVNDNATYQDGINNANRSVQFGKDNSNQTGQFGRGVGSMNYNESTQVEK